MFDEKFIMIPNLLIRENTMETKYKEFSIITGAECDDTSGTWNGRYRILDDQGMVVYESFVEPRSDQAEAHEAAKKKAHEWVDMQ
jgi:hypothetical protein